MVWIWNAFEWRKNDFETEMRDRKNIKHWYMVIQFTGHKTFRYYAYEVVFRFGFYIGGWSIKLIETERETYQCGVLSYLIQVYILWIWINQSTSQSIINQLNQPTQQPLRQIQSNCFFFFCNRNYWNVLTWLAKKFKHNSRLFSHSLSYL